MCHLFAIAADAVVYDHGLGCNMVILDAGRERQFGHVSHLQPQVIQPTTRVETQLGLLPQHLQLFRQRRHPDTDRQTDRQIINVLLERKHIELQYLFRIIPEFLTKLSNLGILQTANWLQYYSILGYFIQK